ncbi:SH3 domain-containing protein [Heterostelium album PN500]|uniref:SH3 domain-containing protein n=1 Tax=Heterostelium pallidum (strain ATCC 26659 / Pp 5 / PN500) TaxID=670386 RepID=D3AY24_HETP5|nr:SH3 domain-containing protein [Heterostelium album PN500]EFA85851.1 SH3 domain-containing protein [Heterostelium album PN500]|eukprot:XP_020437957.1 SH3 domain-containing protein [Heterostelium album PN500]
MTIETFKDNFWGPGGFDILEKRINQATESTKYMLYFLKERASIEESYAKNLQSLLKRTSNIVEYGTLRDAWFAVRGQVETTISTHQELASKLDKDIVSSFQKFKSEQKKNKRNFLHDAWKLSKERRDQENNIAKYRSKYEDYSKQSEQLNSTLESAKSSGKGISEIAKIQSRYTKAIKERDAFESDYRNAVTKLASNQPAWEEKTASIYQTLQATEEERIDCIKVQLDKYGQAINHSQSQISSVDLSTIVSDIDKYEDINSFIREHKTGSERPPLPVFVPYGRNSSEFTSAPSKSFSSSLSTSNSSPATLTSSASSSSINSSYKSSSSTAPTLSKAPPPTVVARKPQKQVKALYDYVGSDATELDFYTGDIITVLDEDESGWWKGSVDGREGLFPSNYCDIITPSNQSKRSSISNRVNGRGGLYVEIVNLCLSVQLKCVNIWKTKYSSCTGQVQMVAYSSTLQSDFVMANAGVNCNSQGCTISNLDCTYNCQQVSIIYGQCSNGLMVDQSYDVSIYQQNPIYSEFKIGCFHRMIWTSSGCSAFYSGLLVLKDQCINSFFGTPYFYQTNSNQINFERGCNSGCSSCSTQNQYSKSICYHQFYAQGNKFSNFLLS